MFNFEWSNATLFYGLYERTDQLLAELADGGRAASPRATELALLEEFRDQLPPEIFTEPAYTPPVQKPERTDRAAIRQASKLLDEAGWKIGPGGLRKNAKGETLTIELVDDNASFERIINPFVAEPAPDRHRRQLPADRPGADAGAAEALRLRHHPRPAGDVAQPLDRAPRDLRLGQRRHPGLAN